jgi:hypothetical protein
MFPAMLLLSAPTWAIGFTATLLFSVMGLGLWIWRRDKADRSLSAWVVVAVYAPTCAVLACWWLGFAGA